MDLPVNVSTGMVVGRYIADVIDGPDANLDPDAQSVQGRIVFTASVPYLPNPTAGPDPVTIMRVPIVGVLDQDGYLCTPYPGTLEPQYRGVRLIATDDPDIAVTDWTWDVTYIFEPINGHKLAIPAHGFALPSGGTVDLTKVAKVPSSPGYSLPQAEAAVLRAEEAALTSAQDAANALAAALRSEQAAAATDQGITDMLSDPDTQSGGLLAEMLDPKANADDVAMALADKAGRGEVESLVASKADAAETTEALGSKANQLSVDNALSLKADKSAVATSLADKADLAGGKVPEAQIPARLQPLELGSTIDDRTTLFNELAVNVKRYGAKGNNSADDTAAIQAAEAVANASTRPLYFPNGSYLYSHTITARVVVGESRQKTRLKYTGATDAVGNGGELAYHRRWEHLTIVGTGVGVGLNLNTSPAGSYRNMIVENFETGIYLDGGSSLYNVFDDVTVQSTVTGVKIDGLAHESRFKNFRINFAQIGFDVMGAGRTVIDSSSIENCTLYGVVIRDRGAGRNVATTMFSTRFEFNPVNIRIEPNVTKTAIIACHPVGGIIEDLGIDTIQINTNGNIITSGTVTTSGTVKGENVEATALKGDRVQARSSFNDARIQLVGTGTVIDRNVDGSGTGLRVNLVHETATGSVVDFQRKSATVARITNSGHLAVRASAAPPDASIVTGEAAFWIDTTNGSAKLMVKAKQADGTVKNGSIPLA